MGTMSHTLVHQGQDPQIGSKGRSSRPFWSRGTRTNTHTHTHICHGTHTPSTGPSKAPAVKKLLQNPDYPGHGGDTLPAATPAS